MTKVRILGIDPGLNNTGWGVVDSCGGVFDFVAAGILHSDVKKTLAERLCELHKGLIAIIDEFRPDEASIEQTFVNKNPNSTLKLGQARGAVIVAPALKGIPVFEYAPNQIKKMSVGAGHADKTQVDMMVRTMLKGLDKDIKLGADASDALAMALTHAYMRSAVGVALEKNK